MSLLSEGGKLRCDDFEKNSENALDNSQYASVPQEIMCKR